MRLEFIASLAFGVLLLGKATSACAVPSFAVIDETDNSTNSSEQGSGGSGDSEVGSGGKRARGCESASWPAPPTESDPGLDVPGFVVAVRSIDFGEANLANGPTVGYNLDERCSCVTEGQSCKLAAEATEEPCDGPGGIDNQLALLFAAASQFAPSLSSESQSQRAESGDGGLLVTVADYNGQPNDSQISVGLVTSPGVDKDPCYEVDVTPKWDGTDRWAISATAVDDPEGTNAASCGNTPLTPKYIDYSAYVNDGVMVANLPTANISLSSKANSPNMTLSAGFVTAKLTKIDGSWHLRDGILAARWRLSDIFAFVGSLDSNDEPICTDHLLYGVLKSAICMGPDLTAELGGPTTPCDAISMGLGFTADPARLGIVYQSTDTSTNCMDNVDPANDSCGSD